MMMMTMMMRRRMMMMMMRRRMMMMMMMRGRMMMMMMRRMMMMMMMMRRMRGERSGFEKSVGQLLVHTSYILYLPTYLPGYILDQFRVFAISNAFLLTQVIMCGSELLGTTSAAEALW